MHTNSNVAIWSPRRRHAFHVLAAVISSAASCMYGVKGIVQLLSAGFNSDVIVSGIACASFLAGAVMAMREAREKQPVTN